MKKRIYELVDAQEKHRNHPDTFEIPCKVQLEFVKVGDNVKLIFLNPHTLEGERMWVKVTEAAGTKYVGILRNCPLLFPLKWGDRVEFSRRHIIDIQVAEEIVLEVVTEGRGALH